MSAKGKAPVRRRLVARAISLLLALSVPALVVALEVDWFTIDGGGGTSAGGTYSLSGTIGQPEARPLSGGGFTLKGGFWPAAGAAATGVESLSDPVLPGTHRLAASAPNPFRDRTSLQFELPRPGRTKIRVYDISGRLVSTLVNEELEAGVHEAAWDGRDRSGQRVASGVYLVRMQAENFGATRKVTHLN